MYFMKEPLKKTAEDIETAKNIEKVEKLMDILSEYFEAGELPVPSTIDAKIFIDTKVIDKL